MPVTSMLGGMYGSNFSSLTARSTNPITARSNASLKSCSRPTTCSRMRLGAFPLRKPGILTRLASRRYAQSR